MNEDLHTFDFVEPTTHLNVGSSAGETKKESEGHVKLFELYLILEPHENSNHVPRATMLLCRRKPSYTIFVKKKSHKMCINSPNVRNIQNVFNDFFPHSACLLVHCYSKVCSCCFNVTMTLCKKKKKNQQTSTSCKIKHHSYFH